MTLGGIHGGSMLGEAGANRLYKFQDEKTEEKFTEILKKHYAMN